MYARSASIYDALYARKDYKGEARRLHALIRRYNRSPGRALLDVACGTGGHLVFLRKQYAAEGLDLEPRLLTIARRKCPAVTFHRGDMMRFDLGRRFDVVTCLFSAIGYATTPGRLRRAVGTMAGHLVPGGVLIIEPWLTPARFTDGYADGQFVERRGLTIARFALSRRVGRQSILTFHYLVARRGRLDHFTERHRLGLFALNEYAAALRRAGLRAIIDRKGLMGRGLLIGLAPLSRRANR